MSPTEFLNHNVATKESFSDVNWMVSSGFVILDPLVLRIVVLIDFVNELFDVVG